MREQTATENPAASTSLDKVSRRWLVPCVFVLTFIGCYLRTFALPNLPILSWGDQSLYVTNGYRILNGQMPYRDFFEFLPAGTDLTYALLLHSFGVSLWIPNLLMCILAATAVSLTTLAAARVLRGVFVVVPAIFTLGLGLYGGLDATHHWFSTVFALAAMVVLLRSTGRWHLIAAGALCGVTASFTQSKGACVTLGFLAYLVWQSRQQKESPKLPWRNCLLLASSALFSFLAINLHYILALGLGEWCRWVIVFPLRYYPTVPSQTFRWPIDDFQNHTGLLKWICAPFLFLAVPAIYVSFLWLRRRMLRNRLPDEEPNEAWPQLELIAITGLAMFLGVLPSLSIMRASAVCLPATIIFAWQIQHLAGKFPRAKWLRLAAVAVSIACALDLAISTQRMRWRSIDLPAGRVAISDPGRYELYLWMKEHTRPGQPYLGIAPLPFALHLTLPGPIHAPGPWEYYRPEHIARSIDALEANRIPLLVLRSPDQFRDQFRDQPGYMPNHLKAFQDYVNQHYRKVQTFSTGDEAWQRISEPAGK